MINQGIYLFRFNTHILSIFSHTFFVLKRQTLSETHLHKYKIQSLKSVDDV